MRVLFVGMCSDIGEMLLILLLVLLFSALKSFVLEGEKERGQVIIYRKTYN